MPFFKVDDHLHAHRKTFRAGVPAMGLWVIAGSWSFAERTDGWVPDYVAARLDPQYREHAADLVRSGLWHESSKEDETGWQFHEWDEWQHTADYLAERNRRAANRMRAKRAAEAAAKGADAAPGLRKRDVRANAEGTSQDVRRPQPNPRQEEHPSSADADGFDAWYSEYPRKVGKEQARRAYRAAVKRADRDALLAGLRASANLWRTSGTEAKYIPHPATWLNGGRWEDAPQVEAENAGAVLVTLMQCAEDSPHERHLWDDGPTRCLCRGVVA